MAILWMEGFETWATVTGQTSTTINYLKLGATLVDGGSGGFDIIATGQRNGVGKFLRFHWDAVHTYFNCFYDLGSAETPMRSVINTSQTWILGLAFRVSALPATNKIPLLRFNCSGKDSVYVLLDSTGKLKVSKSTAVMTESSNTSSISTNTWYYLEFKCKRSASTALNDIEVRINGSVVVVPASGQSLTIDHWTDFCVGDEGNQAFSMTGTGQLDIDDLYLIDDQGSYNTGYLGDCMVETLLPDADGASTQWTPNSGSNNYSRVNEAISDGDTTYVSTTGVGNRDSYSFADLSSLPTSVFGVQVTALARKDAGDGATRTANVSVRSGGSYSDGPTSSPIATAYNQAWSTTATSAVRGIFEADPSSAAWTGSTINAMEAGVKLVS